MSDLIFIPCVCLYRRVYIHMEPSPCIPLICTFLCVIFFFGFWKKHALPSVIQPVAVAPASPAPSFLGHDPLMKSNWLQFPHNLLLFSTSACILVFPLFLGHSSTFFFSNHLLCAFRMRSQVLSPGSLPFLRPQLGPCPWNPVWPLAISLGLNVCLSP
jgi:hypothetical protein